MTHATHVTDYLRILSKRRWIAGLMFLVVFVYGSVTSLKKTPIYEASTQLLIDVEMRRANSLSSVLQDNNSWYDDDFYQTQYRILQSRALAWRTIQALGLAKPPPASAAPQAAGPDRGVFEWLAGLVGAPARIEPPAGDETTWQSQQVDAFLGGLQIEPVRQSRLVNVRYRSPDPLMASRAANAVAEAYRDQGLSMRLLASKETNEFLGQRLEDQRLKVQQAEEALQAFKERYGAVAVSDGQSRIQVQKLTDLSGELTQARLERIEKEALYQQLAKAQGNPAAIDTFPAIVNNQVIQRTRADIATLESQDAQLVARNLGPNFGERVAIASQLDNKRRELDTQITQVVDSVRTEYEVARARETSLEEQYAMQTSESLSVDRQGISYLALEREATSARQLFDNLMLRAQETGVTGEYRGSNVQVVDVAEVPRSPILPNTRRDITFALMAGLVLAIGLAFGLEYLDNRIKTPDEIKLHLGLPFLGLVPAVSDKETGGQSPLLDNGAPPAFAEAMRAIRTAVVFSSAAEGARTVVVTSTAPSEGKTLVSTNLASALGQAEQRTLVIDGDMRRPRVHDVFGCTQEPGLSNVLVGTTQLRSAIRQTSNPYLAVLPAGHIPPNPAELLGSARYRRLLEELGQDYDWIVIDAPPVMAVTDAAVVANGASGVVFVIGAEMTPRRSAQTAVEQLTSARAKIIGAVLNRANVQRHSYYYAPYHRKDYTQAYIRSQ
ncbi:MAG TPA: polysaccharide biosynthesis tyrosine autokinase [Vicinamibacterales bacterium]|nr:polysaccharide biosynthesis tyrosine autokinase [Vicinamibacterales bacterium]